MLTGTNSTNPIRLSVDLERPRAQRSRWARTALLIGSAALMCTATAVVVLVRRPEPQTLFPAGFPNQSGLLGYWTGDDSSLAATAGPNLSGTASYASGDFGPAFDLSATSNLSTMSLPEVSTAVSIMMWVKPTKGQVMTLASRNTGPGMRGTFDNTHSYTLMLFPSNELVWQTDDMSSRVPEEFRAPAPTVFDGQFHLVAATWDTTTINLYIDGALVATKASQGGTLNGSPTTPFRLGGEASTGFNYVGLLDDASVWSRALTATEISNYSRSRPRVTATIPVGGNPTAMSFDGTNIWVTNVGAGSSKIDPATNTVVATVNAGDSRSGPAFDGTHLWFTCYWCGTVKKVDPTTNTVVATVAVGGNPWGIAFDGTNIWVANNSAESAQRINPSTTAVTATVPVGVGPWGIAFDGTSIWVTNYGQGNYKMVAGTVSRIDPTANAVTATIAVGGNPTGVTFDGTSIWVANYGLGSAQKIDRNTNAVTASAELLSDIYGVTFDGTNIWAVYGNSGAGRVARIDPHTSTVTATVPVGVGPFGMAFDGANIWVANPNSGTVSKIPV